MKLLQSGNKSINLLYAIVHAI